MKERTKHWTKLDEAVGSNVSELHLDDAVLVVAKIFGRGSRGDNDRFDMLSEFNNQPFLDAATLIELEYPEPTVHRNLKLFKELGLIEEAYKYQRSTRGGRKTTVWKLRE